MPDEGWRPMPITIPVDGELYWIEDGQGNYKIVSKPNYSCSAQGQVYAWYFQGKD